jgi:hypothetical protein
MLDRKARLRISPKGGSYAYMLRLRTARDIIRFFKQVISTEFIAKAPLLFDEGKTRAVFIVDGSIERLSELLVLPDKPNIFSPSLGLPSSSLTVSEKQLIDQTENNKLTEGEEQVV